MVTLAGENARDLVVATFDQQRFKDAWEQMRSQVTVGTLKPVRPTLHVFASLASTNDALWSLIEQGAPPGTVVIAHQQQAGRGQWGRQWSSPPGGLYLSLFLVPELAIEYAPQLTLCSAWGIATGLRAHQVPVQIKWPNDLVVQGRKLGGILTETRLQSGQIGQAVVGVGINWANPVPETGLQLQALAGHRVQSIEQLATIVIWGILSGFLQWQQQGIAAMSESYLELLAGRDRPLIWQGQAGTIAGIAPTGELRVCLSGAEGASSEILLQPGSISLGYDSPEIRSSPAGRM